jgi:hypothetical protein
MAINKLKKRVGAWIIMDIFAMEDMSVNLLRLIGPIVDSNFLALSDHSEMPVVAEPFENIGIGDRVKLVYFTTKGELESFKARKSMGFTDTGLRYFKWNDGGWDLVYEG